MPGHLATITSQGENDFITGHFWTHDSFLGGYQPSGSQEPAGGWQWVTGETWSYTNWVSMGPDNVQGADVLIFNSFKWSDFPSQLGYKRNYIIEYEALPPPGIPEFPSVALPVIVVIGLMFLFQKKKGQ